MGFLPNLNITSFNVDGLMSKVYDPCFLSFLKEFDIICLLETFVYDYDLLPVHIFSPFTIYFCPALKLTRHGRCSGGVLILVKNTINTFITKIQSNIDNVITLKINTSHTPAKHFFTCVSLCSTH